MMAAEQILKGLLQHRASAPFRSPVTDGAVLADPDYQLAVRH